MGEYMTILGLPAKTWIIVGGLYLISAFLPSIISFILGRREKEADSE